MAAKQAEAHGTQECVGNGCTEDSGAGDNDATVAGTRRGASHPEPGRAGDVAGKAAGTAESAQARRSRGLGAAAVEANAVQV